MLQEKILADMCTRGVLSPDAGLQCRYRIRGTELDVDVLSPAGFNVGGVNPWFDRAAKRARAYDVGDGRSVMALTPPYFLTTKLVAFEDRGPDAQSSKDAEDIVTLLVEVPDLLDQVDAEGVRAEVAVLWGRVLAKYSLRESDLPDLVDWHLDSREASHRRAVIAALGALAGGSV